jgi:hypothetical protein
MSATLNIINNFTLEALGLTISGKQGNTTDDIATPFPVTVNGPGQIIPGSLLTATVVMLYDASVDAPAAPVYFFLWTDQDCDIQLIGSGSNVILPVKAKQPFILSGNSLLAAANTTPIAGGATPSLTTLAKVVLGNYSGNTMNYLFAAIN